MRLFAAQLHKHKQLFEHRYQLGRAAGLQVSANDSLHKRCRFRRVNANEYQHAQEVFAVSGVRIWCCNARALV